MIKRKISALVFSGMIAGAMLSQSVLADQTSIEALKTQVELLQTQAELLQTQADSLQKQISDLLLKMGAEGTADTANGGTYEPEEITGQEILVNETIQVQDYMQFYVTSSTYRDVVRASDPADDSLLLQAPSGYQYLDVELIVLPSTGLSVDGDKLFKCSAQGGAEGFSGRIMIETDGKDGYIDTWSSEIEKEYLVQANNVHSFNYGTKYHFHCLFEVPDTIASAGVPVYFSVNAEKQDFYYVVR